MESNKGFFRGSLDEKIVPFTTPKGKKNGEMKIMVFQGS